ncbi:MAG: hypothetical protein HOP12_08895 [Candidatus Eisenbacteria bacterium]|uniref:Uncharacterized protein n=1 Tax=Eiseniibacteriota bacterium TaxID=2212470 RepID=A0A849SSB7_UNCEI|nr:hypothetical protein [Candidatus Eisenbacteria bacterium]
MILASLVLPGVVHGCSSPTEPPAPPSGGQQVVLSYALFQSSVEPVITRHGCDAEGDCHGGGIRGTLELSPPGAKNAQFDYNQLSLQVWATALESSPILTEPLAIAAGGTPHQFKPFATKSDSDWVALHAWVTSEETP